MARQTVYPASETFDEEAALQDWAASLDEAVALHGKAFGERILRHLRMHGQAVGMNLPLTSVTPYANSIPASLEPEYPGDLEMETRITNLIRWNAMVMVHRANKRFPGLGGHIATYASCATLYEVGQNHFFRGRAHPEGPDFVYFQGHASPGMYARAFLEGRLSEEQIDHFRREAGGHPGLSSYPHPWLMPDFWQFPTVSMGLGPLSAIYHARFIRYLEDRGLKEPVGQRIWCMVGDGETDEPETLGAINLAAREKLDNLVLIVNCNLQRLDGPVRGNGKIIQELEGTFRGSGWRVLKVIWGSDWDPLFARDTENRIIQRAGEIPDGEFQKYTVEPGWYMREHFFGTDDRLLKLVEHIPDQELKHLDRGGHDPKKVHAAFRAASEPDGRPTVILTKTVKGFGMGVATEGLNIAHNAKKMPTEALQAFRDQFGLDVPDDQLEDPPFLRPHDKSAEIRYLRERRRALGGFVPERRVQVQGADLPDDEVFAEFREGSGDREVSTTMAFVRMLGKVLKDESFGPYLVPIVPDESRPLGLAAPFRPNGIYSHVGQLYEPVDKKNVLYYKEATDGQILEEGITEAGSMASFLAAGTAYANHGLPMIPVYLFYSMFGFQRTGDQMWQAGDSRARGFLVGGTAGRTTLNGEGLQHQDGHSHVHAGTVPNVKAYDPAYSYEIAVIVEDGLRRMMEADGDWIYYLTVQNETYVQPPMPEDARQGILSGLHRIRSCDAPDAERRVQLFGSGSILQRVLAAADLLAERWDVQADVWSATSYKELRTNGLGCDHWNRLHPAEEARVPYLRHTLRDAPGPVVAATDYLKLVPDGIRPWLDRTAVTLGTDGYGRSDTREALRAHFEVDERFIALAALDALRIDGKMEAGAVREAMDALEIDPEKRNPLLT